MNTLFALNYSRKAAALLRAGDIEIDLFKCPAWPDLIAESQSLCATYTHFPLRVGAGCGEAIDEERKQPADWGAIEALMARTQTPQVNLHLAPGPRDYADLPADTTEPALVERVTQNLLRDVRPVVARFGAEHVLVENCHPNTGTILRAACLPEVIQHVVGQTGCGLLLDLSHARLAAGALGGDARDYVGRLPVGRLRELHVTGLQRVDERWASLVRAAPGGEALIGPYVGRLMDHLPMTDPDWDFMQWALEQVRGGAWGTPWVVTSEYGGVGGAWEAVTFTDVLQSQVPRMYNMVHAPA